MDIQLRWPAIPQTEAYKVYVSYEPGGVYGHLYDADASELSHSFSTSIPPRQLTAFYADTSTMELLWQPPALLGAPMTFKVPYVQNNTPSFVPEPDTPWWTGAPPIGAHWLEQKGMSSSTWSIGSHSSIRLDAEPGDPACLRFVGAFAPLTGYMIVWIWVPHGKSPETLWVEFHDGESWSKAVYVGLDLFFAQEKGKDAFYHGEIPAMQAWSPLVIPLWQLGLTHVHGLAIGMGHRSSDSAIHVGPVYSSQQPVFVAEGPYEGIRGYKIYRGSEDIGFTQGHSFVDAEAHDRTGLGGESGAGPVFRIEPGFYDDSAFISWSGPESTGTEYQYRVVPMGYNGTEHDEAAVKAVAQDDYGYAVIYADTSPITEATPALATVSGSSFHHQGLGIGETYYYRFDIFSPDDELLYRHEQRFVLSDDSLLDHFRLDHSRLA